MPQLDIDCESEVVYCGYFFGQYPCGWLIGRFPAQRVLSVSCLFWGLLVIIQTQCRDFNSARESTHTLFLIPPVAEPLHCSGSQMWVESSLHELKRRLICPVLMGIFEAAVTPYVYTVTTSYG